MNKNVAYGIIAIVLIAGLGMGIYWITIGSTNGGGEGASGGPQPDLTMIREYILSLPYQNLTEEEIQGLLYMREEEKLAHDVYLYAYEMYGTKIFYNIANSESTHTYMVSVLIDKYNLTDPAENEPAGVFKNATIQLLYYDLIEKVNESEKSALIVGGNIEELDIVDIKNWMNRSDNEDIIYVYTKLINGSGNHLRAFVSTLKEMYYYTYTPQYLSEEEYTRIINGENP